MAIAQRRESSLENERAESLRWRDEDDETMEMARARQKRSEKERENSREKREERARSRRGERERSVCRKGGTRGEKAGKGEGLEDEGGTKYRRRTAVGIKRRDERRCGGPTLFFVEDWTAPPLLLRRPSCPSTSSFLPSSSRRSFFSSSSLSRAPVQVCVQRRRVRALSPHVLLYRSTLYLTSSPIRSYTFLELVYREHNGESARCAGWRGDAPRGATTHNARSDYPGAGRLSFKIILQWTLNARHFAPERAELNVLHSPKFFHAQVSNILWPILCVLHLL